MKMLSSIKLKVIRLELYQYYECWMGASTLKPLLMVQSELWFMASNWVQVIVVSSSVFTLMNTDQEASLNFES